MLDRALFWGPEETMAVLVMNNDQIRDMEVRDAEVENAVYQHFVDLVIADTVASGGMLNMQGIAEGLQAHLSFIKDEVERELRRNKAVKRWGELPFAPGFKSLPLRSFPPLHFNITPAKDYCHGTAMKAAHAPP